jgi:hypothetical protein
MKMKRLQMHGNSSMFALLRVFATAHINARNKAAALPDFTIFTTPREHPLDAVGYAKLFRPRSYFLGIGEWENLCFRVKGL